MFAGPSSFMSSLEGRSSGTNGLEISAVVLALNDRLQVPSGEDIRKFLAPLSKENIGFPLIRKLSTSSITLERLSLSMISGDAGSLGGWLWRRERARAPSEPPSSDCAAAQTGSVNPRKTRRTPR